MAGTSPAMTAKNRSKGFTKRALRTPALLRRVAGRTCLFAVVPGAFFRRHRALADDAGTQISDDIADLLGAQGESRGIKVVRRRAGWLAVAAALLVGVGAEARHAGAGAPAPDRLRDGGVVEPGLPQVGTGGRLVAFLFAVGEGAVAFRAARGSPHRQPRFLLRLVLSVGRGRTGEHRRDGERGAKPRPELSVLRLR